MSTKSTNLYAAVLSNVTFKCGLGLLGGLLIAGGAVAAGQVSSIQTSTKPATPFTYSAGGIEYQWGMGNNQIMEGFTSGGQQFEYTTVADRVDIRRDDIQGIATGEPCGIFVERISDGDASRQFAADYPSDGSGTGNCDIPAMLASRVLNRGAVDLFSNELPDAKNIERLDYLFDFGLLAPFTTQGMALAGHVAAEKSSNNAVKVAAILKLDILGQPAAYGPLVLIAANSCTDPVLCYGMTDIQHTYSFLQNDFNAPQSFPLETERSFESLGMAFVSAANLGLQSGQRYYGFSVFADDVDPDTHNLLDPTSFPNDTADNNVVPGDDADIYGGMSGYFIAESLSVTTGAVFNDVNNDGMPNDGEAGISDIGITLFQDINGNGVLDVGVDVPLGDSIDSNMSGEFVLPGLPDGNFLVVLDESDSELPPGLEITPGTNPRPLTIGGGDSEPVNFAFISPGNPGGSDGADGAADSGVADGGADGTADSGVADGGADGTADSGVADGGADGTADSGVADGGADGTADSGVADGGADGTADSGVADGGADGTADSGATDGGTPPINDPSTVAVDDVFSVNQGSSETLDVLANDLDGAGGGLNLVMVSSSPNATITIEGDQISYRPNFGFYTTGGSPDTFLYVVEDADGTQVTGNVAVNVVRFSDLNNNMLNDFVECNCTNLTLETGVNGSGVGSISAMGSAIVLIFLLVFRIRPTLPLIRKSVVAGEQQ